MSFGVEGTETVTGQDQHYIYLSVQPDYGIATQYRTDNLIYMQKTGLFLPNTDTLTESSVPDSDLNDSETQDSSTTDSTENSSSQESQKASPLQDEMRAVYQYIQQQNPLPDMNFTYTANAKGENYAILSETTEEKDGTTVNVNTVCMITVLRQMKTIILSKNWFWKRYIRMVDMRQNWLISIW